MPPGISYPLPVPFFCPPNHPPSSAPVTLYIPTATPFALAIAILVRISICIYFLYFFYHSRTPAASTNLANRTRIPHCHHRSERSLIFFCLSFALTPARYRVTARRCCTKPFGIWTSHQIQCALNTAMLSYISGNRCSRDSPCFQSRIFAVVIIVMKWANARESWNLKWSFFSFIGEFFYGIDNLVISRAMLAYK